MKLAHLEEVYLENIFFFNWLELIFSKFKSFWIDQHNWRYENNVSPIDDNFKTWLIYSRVIFFNVRNFGGGEANELDCNFLLNMFELQWRYYVFLRTNIPWGK